MWTFQLFGFPVRVEPFFFVVAFFLGAAPGVDLFSVLIWVAVAFVSVLAHELGHAFAGRRYALAPEILLHGMGGLTSWRGARLLSPPQSILLSLAGPAAGLALGGLVWAAHPVVFADPSWFTALAIRYLIAANLQWSLFNLLPILPLDGGQVTRSLVVLVRRRRDEVLPLQISMVTASVLALWALSGHRPFLAMFMGWFVYRNYVALRALWGGARARPR